MTDQREMNPTIAISAGEASGDLHGAHLVAEMKKLMPDLRFWGAGGPKMREAGVDIDFDFTGGGTIGISSTLKSLPAMFTKYIIFRRRLLLRLPNLFVPIDFGAFNLRLAQVLAKRGMTVVYYFPPSSWRRRPRNASSLLAGGGKVVTPFKWSAEYLSSEGIDARWVGHPIVDIAKPTVDRSTFLREIGLDESLPVIGLLPGSRGHEVAEHLGPMVGCAEIMDRELGGAQFVVAAVGGLASHKDNGISDYPTFRKKVTLDSIFTKGSVMPSVLFFQGRAGIRSIRVVKNRTYDCMSACDLLICKSGTATLEAAVIGTPMVIVYRGTALMRLEYRLRHRELEEFIGMPNIIADRGICPELINEDVTAEKLARVALGILRDKEALTNMRDSLAEVKRSLGEPGAISRAARAVLEMGGLA
ncbi:MAG: hypothetical protein N3B12_09240 [Armatimonadetes bacterium]|nr:hypothetical protein [Armatimonadota bacterium]